MSEFKEDNIHLVGEYVEDVVEAVGETIPENDLKPVEDNVEDNVEEELSEAQKLRKKSDEFKESFERTLVAETNFELKNSEGEYIKPRKYGSAKLESIPLENIKLPPRARKSEQDVFALQEQIKQFGLLEPIHVVEHGDFYLLLHGFRRLQAYINLGYTEIYSLVDSTIPPELVKYYEGVVNSTSVYTFSEKVDYGQHFKNNQPTIGYETIEGILGMKSGEFLKALYINELKVEFHDTYMQVEKGKLTIEQGFKKIEKEIEKREKEETAGIDDLNSGALDDQLRSTNELMDLNNDAGSQELGKRKILDPVLRRSIENRDGGFCQCCGYGKDEPDLMGVFNVHHMVAVQYGGSDNKSNLILVCNNCHTLVHDYEKGRFLPDKETFERLPYVQKIVVLGNILATMKKKGLAYIKSKHPDTYRVIDAGKTTLGQTLQKLNVDLKGEEFYNNSPYQTFVDCAYNIDNDITDNDLQKVNYEDDEEETTPEPTVTIIPPNTEEEASQEFLDSYMKEKDIEGTEKTDIYINEIDNEDTDNSDIVNEGIDLDVDLKEADLTTDKEYSLSPKPNPEMYKDYSKGDLDTMFDVEDEPVEESVPVEEPTVEEPTVEQKPDMLSNLLGGMRTNND